MRTEFIFCDISAVPYGDVAEYVSTMQRNAISITSNTKFLIVEVKEQHAEVAMKHIRTAFPQAVAVFMTDAHEDAVTEEAQLLALMQDINAAPESDL